MPEATKKDEAQKSKSGPQTDKQGRILNSAMTAAEAAKLVKRKQDDVLSFADYGDRVVVVTTAGEKLEAGK